MDDQTIKSRLNALKLELAILRDAEAAYRRNKPQSPIAKAARDARLVALERIKTELGSLLNKPQ